MMNGDGLDSLPCGSCGMKSYSLLMVLVGWLVCATASVAQEAAELRFEKDVRPILKAHCFHCHGEEPKPEGQLDVRLVRWIVKGGESGTALVPGKIDESLIWKRVAAGEMPPAGKSLNEKEKSTLRTWIQQGAKTSRAEPEAIVPGADWTEEERSYWAFQPVRRPAVPAVKNADLVSSPIDAFLLQALEQKGLAFASTADRVTLVRRLSFALTGLPPTPEQVERFASDNSTDAYARLVEDLLASPAFGERWARHWLDPVGYADSDGYTENDRERPWSYRYRDYVIRAFNSDKPFDQFLVEQLAGDELLQPPYQNLSPDDADRLTATGFLRMAPDGTGEGGIDQNVARNDVVAETIKIVSTSVLGITVGCAQCHSHRYDPISQSDYFRIRSIFEPALDWKSWRDPPGRLVNMWSPTEHEQAAKVDVELRDIEVKRLAELDGIVKEVFEKEVGKLTAEQQTLARAAKEAPADKRSPEQLKILKDYPSLNVDRGSVYLYEPARLNEFNKKYEKINAETRAKRPADSFVACLTEVPGHKPAAKLFYRGDFNQPRDVVAPGDLSVLPEPAQIPDDDPAVPTTGRRLAFAKHLTNGRHPLVARVIVNRVWLNLFGRGLVASPGDFGVLGDRPTHAALLDWLADEFVKSGWQLKALQRLIVNSTAFKQQSTVSSNGLAVDPENHLLGRMNVRRLEAEAIRDAMLEASGTRTRTMFGPAAKVNPDDVGQVVIGQATRDGNGILVAKSEDTPEQYRRGIYIQVRRSMPLGTLEPFDLATVTPNCERRSSSTVAPQALLMMNNDVILRLSERFAQRVLTDVGEAVEAQVRRAWILAYGRDASTAEASASVSFVNDQQAYFQKLADAQPKDAKPAANAVPSLPPNQQALALLCQALLSSNRFLYVD